MNKLEKLQEATMLALQGKLLKEDKEENLNMQPSTVEEFQSLVCKLTRVDSFKKITEVPTGIDTSKMTDMSWLFADCTNLTTIPLLDTSNVVDMSYMFYECTNLKTIPLLDTSNVVDMSYMFEHCENLTTIPKLDTSNVTSMEFMFDTCTNLKTIPLLDTSKVTRMYYMFYKCTNLTTIPLLNTSKVIIMYNMFSCCTNLTTIPKLDTSNVTNTEYMFYKCTNLTTIPKLDTSNVTKMNEMFSACENLITIPLLDTSKVTRMNGMFDNCSNLSKESLKNKDAMEVHIDNSERYKDTSKHTKLGSGASKEKIKIYPDIEYTANMDSLDITNEKGILFGWFNDEEIMCHSTGYNTINELKQAIINKEYIIEEFSEDEDWDEKTGEECWNYIINAIEDSYVDNDSYWSMFLIDANNDYKILYCGAQEPEVKKIGNISKIKVIWSKDYNCPAIKIGSAYTVADIYDDYFKKHFEPTIDYFDKNFKSSFGDDDIGYTIENIEDELDINDLTDLLPDDIKKEFIQEYQKYLNGDIL